MVAVQQQPIRQRGISLVQSVLFAFPGNVFAPSICHGDVDNDGDGEFVVGNTNGDIAVFKGTAIPQHTTADVTSSSSSSTTTTVHHSGAPAWLSAHRLGTVACIAIGDITGNGKNALLAISAEGVCHIFDVEAAASAIDSATTAATAAAVCSMNANTATSDTTTPIVTSSTSIEESTSTTATTTTTTTTSTASTTTSAGVNRPTIVGGTTTTSSSSAAAAAAAASFPALHTIVPTHSLRVPNNVKCVLIADLNNDGVCEIVLGRSDKVCHVYAFRNGALLQLHKWDLPTSIGSLTVSTDRTTGSPLLVISQPGGGFAVARSDGSLDFTFVGAETTTASLVGSCVLGSAPSMTVSGSQYLSTDDDDLITICSLDGSLCGQRVNATTQEWELSIDEPLFALKRVDMTGKGSSEIVTCGWSGCTYILDSERNLLRFVFDREVAAFSAGPFALHRNKNEPSLVYVNFDDTITVFYNTTLKRIGTQSLCDVAFTEIEQLLVKKRKGDWSASEVRSIARMCLYRGFDLVALRRRRAQLAARLHNMRDDPASDSIANHSNSGTTLSRLSRRFLISEITNAAEQILNP